MTERVWYWLREKGKRPQLKQATVILNNGKHARIKIDGVPRDRTVQARHLHATVTSASERESA